MFNQLKWAFNLSSIPESKSIPLLSIYCLNQRIEAPFARLGCGRELAVNSGVAMEEDRSIIIDNQCVKIKSIFRINLPRQSIMSGIIFYHPKLGEKRNKILEEAFKWVS